MMIVRHTLAVMVALQLTPGLGKVYAILDRTTTFRLLARFPYTYVECQQPVGGE